MTTHMYEYEMKYLRSFIKESLRLLLVEQQESHQRMLCYLIITFLLG
ncbi:hypothetical protein NPIL_435201, partial [Nephila pilipes]